MSTYRDTHKTDTLVRYYWGIKLVVAATPQYFTNAPFSVTYSGGTYSHSYKFNIQKLGQETGALQAISVEISNGDAALGVLMQALSGRYRFPTVTVYEWWFDSADLTSTTIQSTDIIAFGRLEAPSWNEQSVSFSVKPLVNSASAQVPYRGFGMICPYANDYKGEQCGATSGETSCGGTYTECDDRGNTARFGGMRHLPKDGQKFYYGEDGSFIVGTGPYTQ